MKNNKDEDFFDVDNMVNAATLNAESKTINRYGSAVKEHLTAYSGRDNERNQVLKRGLKDISNSKVNPKYEQQNYKQQAGFAAEVKETARENAERAKHGIKNRVTRTDDIGRVNDPLYDHVELDANGNEIAGSGSQMKFVGKNADECLNKLMSKQYQKYRDNNVPFEVPSDYYDDMQKEIDNRVNRLEQQKQNAQNRGDIRLADKHQKRIDELKRTKNNMRKSHVSNKEAMEARKSPRLSTAKDIHKISHEAGIEGAKTGAMIGGGISAITNMVEVLDGKKKLDDAIIDVAGTTSKSAITGYVGTYGGTMLKAAMQNSGSTMIRSLSNTNLPGAIASTVISSVSAFGDFLDGKIDGVELLTRVGKNGVATATSAAYAAAGQLLIPIPIAGAIIGSMVGYSLTTMIYSGLIKAKQEAKMAREERIQVEAYCNEIIPKIRAYRQEMNAYMDNYIADYSTAFDHAFSDIKSSMQIGDVDGFIDGVNQITRKLGGQVQFNNMKEFDEFMKSDDPFIL